MDLKNFPTETPKVQFKGFIHKLYYLHRAEDLSHMIYVMADLLGLHNNNIDIVLEAIIEYFMKNDSHCALVGGTVILRPTLMVV